MSCCIATIKGLSAQLANAPFPNNLKYVDKVGGKQVTYCASAFSLPVHGTREGMLQTGFAPEIWPRVCFDEWLIMDLDLHNLCIAKSNLK